MSMVTLRVEARARGADALRVDRVLPAPVRRHLGPFVFLDHFGPHRLPPGEGLVVRPHPHIGLATVTYLFDGVILHRDSLGVVQEIGPGAVNWMTAGRGIVHSERSPEAERTKGPSLHGLQLWVALPEADEEIEPSFVHHPEATLPTWNERGVAARVLAGEAWGLRSPVEARSPILYAEARLDDGAVLRLPTGHDERGVYVVEGAVRCGPDRVGARTLGVLADAATELVAEGPTRVALLGGAHVGPRHIWWNLLSSRPERIEQAAADWKAGRFPRVPGDDAFIPLPEALGFPWKPLG